MNVLSAAKGSIMCYVIRFIRPLVHIYFIQVSTFFFFSPISSYVEADEIEKQQYCVASSIIGFLL